MDDYDVGPKLDWVANTENYFSVVNDELVLRMPQSVALEEVAKAQAALNRARVALLKLPADELPKPPGQRKQRRNPLP